MASIYITENGVYLYKRGGRLIIDKDDVTVMKNPLKLKNLLIHIVSALINEKIRLFYFIKQKI